MVEYPVCLKNPPSLISVFDLLLSTELNMFIPLHSGAGSETWSAQGAWLKAAEGQRKSVSLQITLNKSCTLPALFPDSWCETTPRWPEGQLSLAKTQKIFCVTYRSWCVHHCQSCVRRWLLHPKPVRKRRESVARNCFRQAEGTAGKQAVCSSSACANDSRIC